MRYFAVLLVFVCLVNCKQDVGLGLGRVEFIITCESCTYKYSIRSIQGEDATPQKRINWKSPAVKTQRRTIVELQIFNMATGPVYGQISINGVVAGSNMTNFTRKGGGVVVYGNNYK